MTGVADAAGNYSGTVSASNGVNPAATQSFAIEVLDRFPAPYAYHHKFGSNGSGNGQFTMPLAVAINPSTSNVVVGDWQANRVQVFSAAGAFVTKFGTTGTGNTQFTYPTGIAIHPTTGHIYVTDNPSFTGRVQVFDANGAYLRSYGGELWEADEIAIDPTDGRTVVIDRSNGSIRVFDAAGLYLFSFGTGYGSGPGEFIYAKGVAIDPVSRDIFVGDHGTSRVQVFDSGGNFLSEWSGFYGPSGIAIDPVTRNIAVSDSDYSASSRIQLFDPAGTYIGEAGSHGTGDGQLRSPQGIAFNGDGTAIAVADRDNVRVQVFTKLTSIVN